MSKAKVSIVLVMGLVFSMMGGVARADFTPNFSMELSDTKVLGHPQIDFHLEFDAEDEEIGNFKATLPKGYYIASDEEIPDEACDLAGNQQLPNRSENTCGETIGSGVIDIAVGPGCRIGGSGSPGSTQLNIDATFYEVPRTDEEADSGVHAVWFLDIEPANRVRLLIRGDIKTGWTIEGAPTPSDATCNPLTVDLTINSESESGVPILTNPKKAGTKNWMADIQSQDSPTIAHFEVPITITK
ncbi:MAG TPA: hypothetical protein VHJ82_07165 [Actinomycetota bacterium]|nr:hypothetical protein [Actinomycetota bacterium]